MLAVDALLASEAMLLGIHLLEPVNLLILDEPTNHLDLKTKDIFKQALQDFDGTLGCVSHDRDFLDGLVTKVYEFAHGKVRLSSKKVWVDKIFAVVMKKRAIDNAVLP